MNPCQETRAKPNTTIHRPISDFNFHINKNLDAMISSLSYIYIYIYIYIRSILYSEISASPINVTL
jgi:hypothetical protein